MNQNTSDAILKSRNVKLTTEKNEHDKQIHLQPARKKKKHISHHNATNNTCNKDIDK